MKQEELESALRQIKEIADKVLGTGNPVSKALKQSKRAAVPSNKASLPDHISALRDNDFFKQPRTITEIHEKLQLTYPCDRGRITTAMRRIIKRNELRKTSKTEDGERVDAFV